MTALVNRQWLLARRPSGLVSEADFKWNEAAVPELADGQVLVRTLCLSCDPTQRGWMSIDTYLPKVELGEVMRSSGAGRVVASKHPAFAAGQLVQGLVGWQDYAVVAAGKPGALMPLPPGVPIETALGALGITGITAYFGLIDVGKAKPGETVVVSGAAGATGSMVAQIGKILGCRVVGIAGGADKCRYLTTELGLDAAIDYKSEDLAERLGETCPKGIDVYFDNVGGDILDAALGKLAMRGRVVICGAISRYNEAAPGPGPKNYMNLLLKRGRMEGFIVLDYLPRVAEAILPMAGWLAQGKLKDRVDVQVGLERAPAALARLFLGQNEGKQLVRVAE